MSFLKNGKIKPVFIRLEAWNMDSIEHRGTAPKPLSLPEDSMVALRWRGYMEDMQTSIPEDIPRVASILAGTFVGYPDHESPIDAVMREKMFAEPALFPFREELWGLMRKYLLQPDSIQKMLIEKYNWDI